MSNRTSNRVTNRYRGEIAPTRQSDRTWGIIALFVFALALVQFGRAEWLMYNTSDIGRSSLAEGVAAVARADRLYVRAGILLLIACALLLIELVFEPRQRVFVAEKSEMGP